MKKLLIISVTMILVCVGLALGQSGRIADMPLNRKATPPEVEE